MTDVVMPQMGESIVEGTLTKWLKKAGDRVERDEPLFEISTDKVDTEIPSPAAGTLSEVLVEEGKTVGINTVLARIDESGGNGAGPAVAAKPAAAPAPSQPRAEAPVTPRVAPALPPEPAVQAEPSGPLSPLVRKMAREHSLDLSRIQGTGAGGRITKQDVERYLAQQQATPAAPPPAPAAQPPRVPPVQAPQAYVPPAASTPAKVRIEPMSTMRSKIAEHMVMSKRTSAHVTTIHRVDMTKVAKIRERQKEDFQARYGLTLTFLPFVTRAAVEGLRAFPIVNASIEGNNILYHNEINIGMAVALENGLIVPVIRHADEKNVLGLQRAIVDLAARARSRQLKPDEVQGGTFSITNFGSFGSVIGTPVINQPQVAILGVGVVEKMPVVIDDAIAIRSTCFLSLTFDHRLIDGAVADQFTGKVKSVLENWSEEVL
ncbi:MAG TPA: 2-oxoglutarate dehydrogenase, E2 component, dihydrolipoamide succinyltransferase [Bryobacteraceae bacterium]|nr:2-oxoglutarate dehydrogenase, E2 component, dihydrolipoamide succinyltransferase [Bryobacteraceae bacterium]